MSIVLNEYEWAEKALADKNLGKKPMETLSRIAKYYHKNRYTKKEIRGMLDDFLIQCDPNTSLMYWTGALDKMVKNVSKYPLIVLDGISITKPEIEKIKELHGVQVQRLAFTLLCVSRYWDMVSPTNNHWVNTEDKEIMSMANINTSVRRQSLMFSELRDAGYISFSKKIDNLNVRVEFGEAGEEVLFINDFRNLGYQYMRHINVGEYYECCNCGKICSTSAKRGRKAKYCSECAAELHRQQRINSVTKQRNSLKN